MRERWIALLAASIASSCASHTAPFDHDAPLTVSWDSTTAHVAAQRKTPPLGEYVYVKVLPEVLSKTEPTYPGVAARRRITGTVIVQALVLTNGRVGDTRVIQTIPELERAAVACVKRWRFKPAQGAHGRPVAVWTRCPVTFELSPLLR